MAVSNKRLQELKALSQKKFIIDDEDVKELTDAEINSLKPLHPELYKPRKESISFRIDSDVLYAFKAMGKGYQTKMNSVLREAVFGGLKK